MSRNIALSLLTPVFILANPFVAQADDKTIQMDITGHFKIYGNYVDQDGSVRATDILRDVDVTISGETLLSSGLTVGVLVNADGDANDGFTVQDSFAYISGGWGELSMGMENGASFALQVAVPSADENIDGLQIFMNPVSYAATSLSGTDFESDVSVNGLDYDNDLTAGIDKIAYMTPVFSGFQAAISYTPDVANFSPVSRSLDGNNPNSMLNEFGDSWEFGARFENKVSDDLSYIAGAGYTTVNVEKTNGASVADTLVEWNAALDMDIRNYGVGIAYTENNGGVKNGNDSKTYVLGADYSVGPIRYGASWLHNTHEETITSEVKTDRLTGGLVYQYGPGLTFRGSVSHVNVDAPTSLGGDVDATSVTIGTEILF